MNLQTRSVPQPQSDARYDRTLRPQTFDEFMAELGFQRRGTRIRAAFENALSKLRR